MQLKFKRIEIIQCLLSNQLVFLVTWSYFRVIFFLYLWWDLNSFKATTTGVLVFIRPSSGRWQAPKQLQVIAKLRFRGTAIQQLSRAAPPQKGCPCSLCRGWLTHGAPCFVPWLLFLDLWLSSSILSPLLASFLPAVTCGPGFISGFQVELLFFWNTFSIFLLLTYCCYVFNASSSALDHDSD